MRGGRYGDKKESGSRSYTESKDKEGDGGGGTAIIQRAEAEAIENTGTLGGEGAVRLKYGSTVGALNNENPKRTFSKLSKK